MVLELDIEQHDVPPGFRMPVPVKIDLGKGKEGQVVVMIDEPHEKVSFPLPAKPKDVVFNPAGAVLARVKKK